MPQFEVAMFFSQIFWMLISFGFLYLVVEFLIYPLVEETLTERDRTINDNLTVAETTNNMADKLVRTYNDAILSAERQKTETVNAGHKKILKEASAAELKKDEAFQKKVIALEAELQAKSQDIHEKAEMITTQIAADLKNKIHHKGASA